MSVYAVRCQETDRVYIGSTTLSLEDKLKQHEKGFRAYKRGTCPFLAVFEILEGGQYSIELVEDCPGASLMELQAREGFHQKLASNRVNRKLEGQFLKHDPTWWRRKKLCPCGKWHAYSGITTHRMTRHHREWVASSKS